MMAQLKILNSKEIKEILKLIEAQWDAKFKPDYAFLRNNKNRIFIINKDISKIELSKLRINSIGIYFCELDKPGIRLSIEGSQIVGSEAKKNVVDVDEQQSKEWFKGEDLQINDNICLSNEKNICLPPAKKNYSGFVLIKFNDDYLGCGNYKEGRILNYVSKSRRISASI